MPRKDNPNLKTNEEIALEKAMAAKRRGATQQKASSSSSPVATTADWKNPEFVKAMIVSIGKQQGLSDDEIAFALSIAAKESGFNVNAHNKGTAKVPENSYGVFQINTDAHPDYTGGLDPIQNITYGTKFAANKLRQAKGNVRIAARNYNGSGPMAEKYSQEFIKNYYPKYSSDYKQGKVASIDTGRMVMPSMPIEGAMESEKERISQNYADVLKTARQQYDWNNAKAAMDMYSTQYNEVVKNLQAQFPAASQEQIAAAADKYLEQIGYTRDFVQKQIDTLQGNNTAEKVLNPQIASYNQASLDLQNQLAAANPYTRLAQIAPIQNLEPIDIEGLKRKQESDTFGSTLLSMLDPNAPRVNSADLAMRNAQQLDQAVKYNQALASAKATGLPMEYFLAGAGMDYNTLGSLGQNRLANQQALTNAYMSQVIPSVNTATASMANNANTVGAQYAQEGRLAQQNLTDYNKEILKQNYDLAKTGLTGVGNIANTALSGANQQGIANTYVVPTVYGTAENNLTSRLNTIENNARALETANLNAEQERQKQQNQVNPVSLGGQLVTAGVYTQNPQLMNAGAGVLLGQTGLPADTMQDILSNTQGINRQQNSNTINPMMGGIGFIPPQMMFPQNNNQNQ